MALTLSADARDHGSGQSPGLFLRHVNGQEAPILTNLAEKVRATRDHSGTWLRAAMIALAVLSVTAAVVSYQAQYRLIYAYKAVKFIAALQAGLPDIMALVMAALGVALALQGKRAIRARFLNVAAVATSIAMNALASSGGWKALSVWVLAPVGYAVCSDTLIGVLRAITIARQRALNTGLADDESTPLAVIGGFLLWTLRLALAPASTLTGFRNWVVEEVPTAPGRKAVPAPQAKSIEPPAPPIVLRNISWPPKPTGPTAPVPPVKPKPAVRTVAWPQAVSSPRTGTKTADLIRIAQERHGELSALPLDRCSKIATGIAAEIGMHGGSARSALLKAARAAQDGGR